MSPTKSKALLQCSQTTATIVFIVVGSLFILTGCARLYNLIGLTDEESAEQQQKDSDSRGEILDNVRTTTSEIVSYAIAGVGSILSGFLAKWLHTERKLTTTLITGIESANDLGAKKSVEAKATAAGLEPLLHSRIIKLT